MKEPMVALNHIDNRPLREKILNLLRDAILSGEIKPGQALVEAELASQLGVSRAPIREALQTLNTEGLVETIPYHGTVVRKLTRTDIEELYSLRSVLETFAIRRIIEQKNPEHIAELRRIYAEMLNSAVAGELKRVNEIDRVFHDTLIRFSNHTLLVSTWSVVAMRVRQVMALRNKRFTDIKEIAYNHLAIIEAIAAGDEARATELIEHHVASAGGLIAGDWDDRQ